MQQITTVLKDLPSEITIEHLQAAKELPDWYECLKWAVESRANVAEMKTWHRVQNGLDLFSSE